LAKFSRVRLFARSTAIIVSLAAALYGAGVSVLAAQESPTAETARYFTINQVLAKLDGQKANKSAYDRPTQLAALDLSTPGNASAQPTNAAQQSDEPFGLATFRAPEGQLWDKWRKLSAELETEAQILARCQVDIKHCVNPAAQKYLALIEESRKLADRAKIDRINRAINAAVRYTSDQDQYGVPDQWTAPLATLTTGKGDCEDYAIAKYVALRDVGFSADDLRLVIVRDRVARQDHAVTSVRQNGHWLMLDNRHEALLERKDAWHFTPLFALDHQGVKLFAAPYGTPPAAPPEVAAASPARRIAAASTALVSALPPAVLSAEALGLRLDTFDPPQLRNRF
jgi:predicted transglutaminase-like cysteine proteinase